MLFTTDNQSRGQAILGPRHFVVALAKHGCRMLPNQTLLIYESRIDIKQ